jgi:cytosine/adenosine deaminase-related metal-dependent hydrolase
VPINAGTDAYVLSGRLVTMGPAGVIPEGRVYVRGHVIEAVTAGADPVPAGFTTAPVVATGATLYPGLIELHNHLAYNAMPLWDVPVKYTNNGQWRDPSNEDYRRRITKPSQVLGQTAGVLQALVRYVECRALFGGVTATQGITLANAMGLTRHFRGLVRNVEQPIDPALPAAGTNIANPAPGAAQAYLDGLRRRRGGYLQHLSEGTDDTARSWFINLRIDDQRWAITDALCGIHATALHPDQLRVLAAGGAGMVWSPTSNYLLYGATADITAAKAAGIRMALGSDWAPSGTKNLLGELKVAWLASREHGSGGQPLFDAEELVRMVTINPATMLRWQQHLGSIEAGKRADLIAVTGRRTDPYRQLIEARETSLTLIVIDGVPRAGRPALMTPFGPGTETVSIGDGRRILNLADADADPLDGGHSLTEAIAVLRDAMARLPELAAALDTAAADATTVVGAADDTGQQWRIVPDFEPDDRALEQAAGLDTAAADYARWVQPMTLDPITVADDHRHLPTLMAARNLPDFVKKGLPGLYGQHLPLPEGADFLRQHPDDVARPVRDTTRELREFARSSGALTLDDQLLIVDQAMLVLQENYVHLPLKRAMYGVDPVQRLRLLRRRLEEQPRDAPPPHEREFHAELTDIFNSVRDRHTGYRLPVPFNTRIAWLPFLVEDCLIDGRPGYLVTKVIADAGPADFVPGVQLTHWNGMTIDTAVARNGDRQPGSNPDARHTNGLNALTVRPLKSSPPPDEDWVTVRYLPLPAPGKPAPAAAEYTQPWLVFEPGQAARPDLADLLGDAAALGVDDHTDDIQNTRKILFAPAVADAETRSGNQLLPAPMAATDDVLATRLPGVFKARIVQPDDTGPAYGYLRIFTFHVATAEPFLDEFIRLVENLPDTGLIIDVRGNGGGLIHAAERLLQLLTPRTIQPEPAQFLSTATNLALCRRHADTPGLTLAPWIPSLAQAVRTGAAYSHGFPITPAGACIDLGQRYFGPSVLITDPLCYSATDMFTAGYQDHHIGPVIGVGGATGAGGANVWTHDLLQQLLPDDPAAEHLPRYRPLPQGAELRVAVRRTTRVADNPGDILEDLGVTPDIPYRMTRNDVLHSNSDLINRAITCLAARRPHPLTITTETRGGPLPRVHVHAANATRIDAALDIPNAEGTERRWFASTPLAAGEVTLDAHDLLEPSTAGPVVLDVSAYDHDQLVARRRVPLLNR